LIEISLRQFASSLGPNIQSASAIARELGVKWPPPPTVSMRNLIRCAPNTFWQNFEQTQVIHQCASICTPRTVKDVVSIVTRAEANGQHVHAFGSSWSFSDCAMTPDVMVSTHMLNNPINTVQLAFNGTQPPNVFHTEAGITIRSLYLTLDQQSPPLALETMGGSSWQTVAGAVSTGTHGGDIFLPPIADCVLAIHLVGAGGTQYWIEPTAAITDKALLQKYVVPDIALQNIIYDDRWFNAVLVSLGCMGIIYAVVLRVRLQYNLIETTISTTWQSFKQGASAQLADKSSRFLQVAVNPYGDSNGNNLALVTTRKEGDISGLPGVQSPSSAVINALLGMCGDLLSADPLASLKLLMQVLQSGISSAYGQDLVKVINDILSSQIELRSVLTKDYANIMSAVWPVGSLGGISYKVMDLRYRPSIGPPDVDPPLVDQTGGYSIEMFFPVEGTGASFLGFVDELLSMVNAASSTFLAGYISVRFMSQTRAFLGMQQWPQTYSVEVSTLPGITGEWELLGDMLDLMYAFDGLPHWGQLLDIGQQRGYGDLYPNYRNWQQIYASLSNNFATRTFENALSSRWQLTAQRLVMNVQIKKLGGGGSQPLLIQVVVRDSISHGPLVGAQVAVVDPVSGKIKAGGTTNGQGTALLSYSECVDPETRAAQPCSGWVKLAGYQDAPMTISFV